MFKKGTRLGGTDSYIRNTMSMSSSLRLIGILAQVQHGTDVEGVIVGLRDIPHSGILERGICNTGIPGAIFHRELIVHVVHGDVLVEAAH